MIRKFTVLLVFLLTLSMAKGYPLDRERYSDAGPREPFTKDMIDAPLDPVSVNSSRPYLMKVPSGENLYLVFHFNGTSGNGVFTFALFQVENETVPNTPKFSDYGSLTKESRGDVIYNDPDNKSRLIRTDNKYRNEKLASLSVVKVESGEDIDGIAFGKLYTANIQERDEYPEPIVSENKTEALLAIYFEGEGAGEISFIDYHLGWTMVLRGGENGDPSTIQASLGIIPVTMSFLGLVAVQQKKRKNKLFLK